MIIIVGLGNPGEKFEHTRHNTGFMAVDFFAQKNEFPEFEMSKKYESLTSRKDDILLAKPQTFMNESGKAVRKLTTHYKLPTTHLVVVHDDIDLPLGKLKISKDSGAGGHKGVNSIITALGKKDFVRIKIGICPPATAVGGVPSGGGSKPKEVEKFVLKKFTKEEMEALKETIKKSVDALDMLIKEGLEKAMNQFN